MPADTLAPHIIRSWANMMMTRYIEHIFVSLGGDFEKHPPCWSQGEIQNALTKQLSLQMVNSLWFNGPIWYIRTW